MLADMDKRFENLDGALRKDVDDIVAAAIKQALAAAGKAAGGRGELGFKWVDLPEGRKMQLSGGTLDAAGCNVRMPNMTETAMTARGLRLKYELDQQDVAGGLVDNWMAWTNLVEGNPLREHCTILQMMGGVARLPNVARAVFAAEADLPTTWPRAGTAAELGVSNANVVLVNYIAEAYVSEVALEDVPGYREIIAYIYMTAWGNTQGSVSVAALKASAASSAAGPPSRRSPPA